LFCRSGSNLAKLPFGSRPPESPKHINALGSQVHPTYMFTSLKTYRATCATCGGTPAERAIRGVLTPSCTLETALSAGGPSQVLQNSPYALNHSHTPYRRSLWRRESHLFKPTSRSPLSAAVCRQ
jgi:hypothetical protein